jgi:hypothetical protein
MWKSWLWKSNGVSEVNIEAEVCACLVFGFCFHIALFHHTTMIQMVIEGIRVFPNVPTPHPIFYSCMHVIFSAQWSSNKVLLKNPTELTLNSNLPLYYMGIGMMKKGSTPQQICSQVKSRVDLDNVNISLSPKPKSLYDFQIAIGWMCHMASSRQAHWNSYNNTNVEGRSIRLMQPKKGPQRNKQIFTHFNIL